MRNHTVNVGYRHANNTQFGKISLFDKKDKVSGPYELKAVYAMKRLPYDELIANRAIAVSQVSII